MANYTKLLLHYDGADGSTTFTDSSIYAKTVTANGNVQIDTAQSVFGGASGLFDGTGDYLTIADSADWDFGTGDFTIDFRIRFTGSGDQCLVDVGGFAAGVMIQWSGGVDLNTFIAGTQYSTGYNFSTGTWYHIAIVRNGTDVKQFVDGVQKGSTGTNSSNINTTVGVRIGQRVAGTYDLNGWMDELRISKGIARWTANFTPPSAAYDNPSSTSSSSSSSSSRSSSSSSRSSSSSSSSSRSSSSSSSSSRSSSSSSSSSRSSSSSSSSSSLSSSSSSYSSSSSSSSSYSSSSSSSSSRSSSSSSSSSRSSSSSSSSSLSSSSSSSSLSSSSSSSSSRSSSSSSSSCRSSSSSSSSLSSSSSSFSHAVYKIDGIDKISKTVTFAVGEQDSYVNDVDQDLTALFQEVNRGFKPMRVTTAQRNAITDPFAGLIVVNVSTNKLNFYTGTAWEAITSA